MLLDIRIFAVSPVYDGCKYILLSINQVKFGVIYIELSTQGFDNRIDEVGISVRPKVFGASYKRDFNKVLQIFAEYIDSIIFAYRLLANIETVGIYLVQFLLKEAIDNLVIDSSRDIRVWHSCMIKMIVA